ncbi:hypothetical protein L195_g046273 [Trifolium pratense]|uniref:Uncharacterized protein n=1 Tax=Trifolium pratense TaxID=57577 RepID=A0A2K3MH74_TRIPR|nr:hypothetical protein L195_g046273 [Trifolium pratense]
MFCQSGVVTNAATRCGTSDHSVPETQLESLVPVARLEIVRPVVAIADQVNKGKASETVKPMKLEQVLTLMSEVSIGYESSSWF